MVVSLVEPIHLEPHNLALEDKSDNSSRTLKKAPSTGGCRVEGYMRVKKVWLGKLLLLCLPFRPPLKHFNS